MTFALSLSLSRETITPLFPLFPDSVKESGGRVLVHCQAGISRSATICLAYLIHARRVRLDEAFEFVKRRRQVISPNLAFMGQLLQFETDVLCPYTVLDSENGATAFQYLCSDNTDLSWPSSRSRGTVQGLRLSSYCDVWSTPFFDPSYTFSHVQDSPESTPWAKTMCIYLVYMLKCTKRLPALDSALFYSVYLLYISRVTHLRTLGHSQGPNDHQSNQRVILIRVRMNITLS